MSRPGTHLDARIVDVAAKLFARDGVAATGMRAIATAAGVSIGAIYHHFGGKEEILERILRQELERRKQAFDAFQTQGMPLQDQIKKVVQLHFQLLVEHADSTKVFLRERFDPTPEVQKTMCNLRNDLSNYVAEIIQKAVARGEVRRRTPSLMASALVGMVESVSLRILERDEAAAEFLKKGPQEIARAIWLWLQVEEEEGEAYA